MLQSARSFGPCSRVGWLAPGTPADSVGIKLAHSLDINPHKWLLTNFDCSTMWCREPQWMVQALSINPEYLKNKASGEEGALEARPDS